MTGSVLVAGAGGQLGEAIAERLVSAGCDVHAFTRAELDVVDGSAVARVVADLQPRVIINGTAYTDVDGAETHPVQALEVNAMAVRSLALAAARVGAVFVHYSTDFVFDGKTDRPYTESDAPNPRGTYALSKLLGEWFAAAAPRHYILRVESLFGGRRARSSIDRILSNVRSGALVRAFVDRAVSPSYVEDVIDATIALVDRDARDAPAGLYHCVNTGWTNWADLSREIARLAGRPDAPIEPIRMADAKLLAARPLFAALSNAKLAAAGIEMPTWQDALARHVKSADRLGT